MSWKVAALAAVAAGGLAAALAPVPAGNSPWVTIKGQVVFPFNQKIPERTKVAVANDKGHCLSNGDLYDEERVINPKTRGLKNAWVYLRPDDDDPAAVFPREKIHPTLRNPKPVEHAVDVPCCQFTPRVTAVRAGDTVRFKNSSPIAHTVKLDITGQQSEAFNVVVPAGREHATKPFVPERTPLLFSCSIHRWMQGYLVVFDHPYVAVTDDDGKFEIKLAPAGKWRIMYRHEGGYHKGLDGRNGFPLEVKDAGRGTMELTAVEFEWPKPN